MSNILNEEIKQIPEKEREQWLIKRKSEVKIDEAMSYLEGVDLDDYFYDMNICQEFADLNRHTIISIIVKNMKGRIKKEINSIHNFIDIKERILRKGAINADKGTELVIPMNMRDGILICIGKGNPEWNNSAPHGAGRLLSRSAAKNSISLSEYKKSMEGIFSTCIGKDTIDESPMAYKNSNEIMRIIGDTVNIIEIVKPIYNFKAGEE